MSQMVYSDDGRKLTEQFEGDVLHSYRDSVGVLTIGYGHTSGVWDGQTCTAEEADQWLADDIKVVVDQINRDCTVELTQGEFDALVDFGFNLGCHALETSTLWKLLEAGDLDGAAAQFPRWSYAGGKQLSGLLRRRMAEQAEFTRD
jgi:lysozyme